MEAGKLDRRITIQRATETSDEFGGIVQTWATLAEVWAAVEFVRDSERFQAGEIAAQITNRFAIRYGLGVTVKDRIVFEGRIYEILGTKEIPRRVGQELTASARAEG